jgi:hypothetical protein
MKKEYSVFNSSSLSYDYTCEDIDPGHIRSTMIFTRHFYSERKGVFQNPQKRFWRFLKASICVKSFKKRKKNRQNLWRFPGRTERSVYGSKWIKYGIFTALRRISFTKIRLRYIYISITEGLSNRC